MSNDVKFFETPCILCRAELSCLQVLLKNIVQKTSFAFYTLIISM